MALITRAPPIFGHDARMQKTPWLLGALLAAATATAAPTKVATVEGITEYALPNGLRVLLFPDDSKPSVTVNVTYFVGSRHEGYGETGMAHLLEHMMFKGTKKHPKVLGQLEARGARSNGTTSYDRTNYFETLAAEKDNLQFALDLEADRMVNALIAPADLKSEFSVVRNEFEIGESFPEGILEERMTESAYLWHNYGKPTIGSRSDIERVPADSLRVFYKRYYQPDNAMLVIAGKFDPQKALALVDNSFGKIPRPKRVLPPTYTVEPVQDGERAVTLRRSGDVQVAGLMYHMPAGSHPDFVAEHAIVDVLTAQPSGRLYKALVDGGLAAKVHGDQYASAEPGVLEVFAEVRKDKSVEAARDKMIEIVEGLAKTEISQDELERWRVKTLRDIELGLTNPENIGVELSEWAAQGDWRMKFIFRDRVKALTPADVKRVAAQYLKQSNRTVGLFIPTDKPDRAPLPDAPDVKQAVASYKGKAEVDHGEAFVASIDNIEKRTRRVTLPSGMKLELLSKKTRGGSVEIVLHLRSGNEQDLKGKVAVASLMRGMVLRGTKKRSYQQIQDELARLKVDLKPQLGLGMGELGSAVYTLTTVRESVPAVLALLGEIVREPSFDKGEFEKLRKETLSGLEQQLQQPMSAGFVQLQQRIFPFPKDDVRYRPSVAEQIERIKAVRYEELPEFHRTFWGAGGATLALVGDFDAAAVEKIAGEQFGAWRAPKPWQRITMPFHAAAGSDEVIKTPDKSMAFVAAALGLKLRDDDADYPALVLADYVYGGGTRSRVWTRLREKEGLSYGTFSFLNASHYDQMAMFVSGAMCAPQNAAKAMTGLLEELKTLAGGGLKDDELKEHKKAYQAYFENELSQDAAVAMMLDGAAFNNRTLAWEQALNAKIQSLSPAQVVAALKKWVSVDSLARVKAGDLSSN
jgi:zinc protease